MIGLEYLRNGGSKGGIRISRIVNDTISSRIYNFCQTM
jgi:hypothetical protein